MLKRLVPNAGYYGWVVVGIAFLCSALTSPGQSFAISLYLDEIMADLQISRVEISSIYAGATLAAALFLPVAGALADRFSARVFLGVTIALLGLALIGFSRVETIWGLGLAFVAVRLLGQGAIGLGTLTVVVRWFRRYRSRALAIVGLGFALGELVFPATIYALIESVGWRASLLVFAALYILVFTPLVSWGLRERRPGETVDGFPRRPAADAGLAPPNASPPDPEFTFIDTVSMPVFWGLLLCAIVPPLVMTGVIFHQVALFDSFGWDAALVPPAFMAFAIGGVVMTYSTGVLLERVPTRQGVAAGLVLTCVAFASVVLPLPPIVGAPLYGLLLGFSSGTIAAANSVLWPDYFGILSLGRIKGLVQAARNGATAVGPPLAALLVANTGSFSSVFLLFGAASLAAAALVLLLLPPSHGVAASSRTEPLDDIAAD